VDDARLLLRLGAGSEPERGEEAEAPDGRREERGGLALAERHFGRRLGL